MWEKNCLEENNARVQYFLNIYKWSLLTHVNNNILKSILYSYEMQYKKWAKKDFPLIPNLFYFIWFFHPFLSLTHPYLNQFNSVFWFCGIYCMFYKSTAYVVNILQMHGIPKLKNIFKWWCFHRFFTSKVVEPFHGKSLPVQEHGACFHHPVSMISFYSIKKFSL